MIETIKDEGTGVARFNVILAAGEDRRRCESRETAEAWAQLRLVEAVHRHHYSAAMLRYLLCEGEPAGGSPCGDELDFEAIRQLARDVANQAYQLAVDAPAVSLLGEPNRHENGRVDVDYLLPSSPDEAPISLSSFERVRDLARERYQEGSRRDDAQARAVREARREERSFMRVIDGWVAELGGVPDGDDPLDVTRFDVVHAASKSPDLPALKAAHEAGQPLPEPAVSRMRACVAQLVDARRRYVVATQAARREYEAAIQPPVAAAEPARSRKVAPPPVVANRVVRDRKGGGHARR